jgi:hypothetical protein
MFTVWNDRYGVDRLAVRTTIPGPCVSVSPAPVSADQPELATYAVWDQDARRLVRLPIVDLGRRYGHRAALWHTDPIVILLEVDGRRMGIAVTGIQGARSVAVGTIVSPASLPGDWFGRVDYLTGPVRLFDAKRLVATTLAGLAPPG